MKNKFKSIICITSMLCASMLNAGDLKNFIVDNNTPSNQEKSKSVNNKKPKDGIYDFEFSGKKYLLEVKKGLSTRAQCPNGKIIKISEEFKNPPTTPDGKKALMIYIQQKCMTTDW
ncbi:hypothetical protein L8X52_06045 [Campylobacter lari]|nr:hypothetical protein [Campylobacter lari]MCV3501185.1 hypothetical protein [Campylobacter lari]